MGNYKTKGSRQLLYKEILTGTSTSMSYTPAIAITNLKYQEIQVIVKGHTTAALELRLQISSSSSTMSTWDINDQGALTDGATSSTYSVLAPNSLLDGVNNFVALISIFPLPSGKDETQFHHHTIVGHEGSLYAIGRENDHDFVDKIEVLVSTSTLAIGTEMRVYGIPA